MILRGRFSPIQINKYNIKNIQQYPRNLLKFSIKLQFYHIAFSATFQTFDHCRLLHFD